MKKARLLGEYYKACAIQAFAKMGLDEVTADAVYLLDRIRLDGSDELSERDMQRIARRFHSKTVLMPAVNRLCEYGWLVRLAPPPSIQTGGRPASLRYKVWKEMPPT